MLENTVEKRLVMETRKRGGIAFKFVSPGMAGVPDRLVLLPYGKMGFVELKAPGRKPRPLQRKRMEQITRLGFRCFVADSPAKACLVLDEIEGRGKS